jgi:UDP-N-acetylglucosamine 4,6-dehydratase
MSITQSSCLNGASVLVTGGTGTFGQAFVRHLFAEYSPARVIVFSRDEFKQHEMRQRIRGGDLHFFLGDVRDRDRLGRAIDGIDVVVHAAALKQVPTAELHPIEYVKTNILGAENVVSACIDRKVKKVIALSTDKAVNPVNVYGATKLCADKIFIAANNLSGSGGPRFSLVRYGNVIGSRGSVVQIFDQCRKTGTLPITDARMTRFWVRVEDGSAFVAQCLDLMQGSEIFVPKVPSMLVVDLAKAVCAECEHEVIGIRPGEKLHEVLIARDDARHTVEFDDYYVVRPGRMNGNGAAVSHANQQGRPVDDDFEYASNGNTRWLDIEALRAVIE